jgi:hypothetical protein
MDGWLGWSKLGFRLCGMPGVAKEDDLCSVAQCCIVRGGKGPPQMVCVLPVGDTRLATSEKHRGTVATW